MVPNLQTANPYYNFDFWANQITPNDSEVIELTVFMPNGILIVISIAKTATLAELKEVRGVSCAEPLSLEFKTMFFLTGFVGGS